MRGMSINPPTDGQMNVEPPHPPRKARLPIVIFNVCVSGCQGPVSGRWLVDAGMVDAVDEGRTRI